MAIADRPGPFGNRLVVEVSGGDRLIVGADGLRRIDVRVQFATADGAAIYSSGEPRFQFSAEKRRVFEVLINRDLARQRGRAPGLCWLDASDLGPLCGVRSEETLGVLATFLAVIQIRTAGGLLVPLMRSRPLVYATARPGQVVGGSVRALWNRLRGLASRRIAIDELFIRELTLVGDVLSDASGLLPGTAFAIYGPR